MKTRGVVVLFTLVILLISFVSAEIVISQQPADTYNLGDLINLPIKVKTVSGVNNFFKLSLLCGGLETEVHKEYVSLVAGDEKQINAQIPLIQSFTGSATGSCTLKASIGEDFVLTHDFSVSNEIEISLEETQEEFKPGEGIAVGGNAQKVNGKFVNGFVDLTFSAEGVEPITMSDTVKNGYFFFNFTLPENTRAGRYSATITIYEKDFEGVTSNTGTASFNFGIEQVPTNLEILFETSNVMPGTNLKVKGVLHDQTGDSMDSSVELTIKDNFGNIKLKEEKPADEFLEIPIEYHEPVAEWSVEAYSRGLNAKANFNIIEKQAVEVVLLNKTVTITNKGNVPYNNSVIVKIGEETITLDVYLKVDETKTFFLSAPDGEYNIEIQTNEGQSITGMSVLTGKTVGIKESDGVLGFILHPIVWIFIIIILLVVLIIVFRKGLKRTFLGRFHQSNNPEERPKVINLGKKGSLISSRSPAKLSLSIKGEKQTASVVALKIKNLSEIQSVKSNTEEIIQAIVDFAEANKASTYENADNLFFISAPIKTKTFKNEITSVTIAQKALSILNGHNKLAKQKIDFGIALHTGQIVAKQEGGILQFMSMGTLITSLKKVSGIANKEILLSKAMKENLMATVKTEKQVKEGVEVYTILEVKSESPENKKFIHRFVEKYERENAERNKR